MDLCEKTENAHRHPWELSRSDCLIGIMRTLPAGGDMADVGAGDRFFTQQLRQLTQGKITAIDSGYCEGFQVIKGLECLQDLDHLPNESVDKLVMMDVLEHVPDEDAFLTLTMGKLRPGGYLVLTVPALQSLYSNHDTFLKHYRRYGRCQLDKVLNRNGVSLHKNHYFYSSLVPPRLLMCIKECLAKDGDQKNEGIGGWSYGESHIFTRILRWMLNFDFQICAALDKVGVHLPGLSLLVVGQKKP